MIRISNLKIPVSESVLPLENVLRREIGLSREQSFRYTIIRRSIDARGRTQNGQKTPVVFVYTVDVSLEGEEKVYRRGLREHKKWTRIEKEPMYAPPVIHRVPAERPVIAGLGPAGLFCGLLLARAGLKPVILERGSRVEKRRLDTERFFQDGVLNPDSNVQFGEGGAGAFSDGKLNTLIKDPTRRGHFVMEEMVKAGAPEEILYDAKPHVGTDRLQIVVKNIREEMLELGADIRFETCLSGLVIEEGTLKAVRCRPSRFSSSSVTSSVTAAAEESPALEEEIPCSALFLGIGHSARDTFRMLVSTGIDMEEKPFAMGLRIEHPREMIDRDQYKEYAGLPGLGAASYKLTCRTSYGRSVYTFCMCPGGYVIASASEPETVVTNGMSNYARDAKNSNSALLVNVTTDDFAPYRPEAGVLSGVRLQQELEHKAYVLGGSSYAAPIQTVGDFLHHTPSTPNSIGDVEPSFTGKTTPSDLWQLLPSFLAEPLAESLPFFGTKIHGFDRPDAILTGIESRSSCPVRIVRGQDGQALLHGQALHGLYPMGEGAGYAGGITSAAIDGMKQAEQYLARYQ